MRMLQTLCKAIMLRRTKESTYEGQPILVLPPRTTEVENPEFSEDENTFYRALETQTQLKFNKYLRYVYQWEKGQLGPLSCLRHLLTRLPVTFRAGTVGSSYTAILVLLLRLRQACCHPHLIKDFGVSAAADVSPDDLLELARALEPQVVERIKATGGNFECPVCYDAVTNPAIFLPCGHDTCSDCFARIADPANAIRDGNENATNAKCPNCRASVDPKRITDFDSFKKVHMQELLSEEEQRELQDLFAEFADAGQEDDDSDSDSDTESDESEESGDIDAKGNLKGFIVNDEEDDSEPESEAEDVIKDEDAEEEGVAGPSQKISKDKGKAKEAKKSKKLTKKAKGKKEKQPKKKKKSTMTLAELKKLSTRNKNARRTYMRRIRKDWMSSAKIDKTMEILKGIMNDPEGEKVLIFSQWTSLLDLLEVPIDQEDWGYRRYDGSMNPKLRGDAVDDFRDSKKDIRILLVSLKAGNAGLNLNAANNIIILDPFWNPYIEGMLYLVNRHARPLA
jgi:SNF2 family DNA or RNA helicase